MPDLYYAAVVTLAETGEPIYWHPFFRADSRELAIDHARCCAADETGYWMSELDVTLARNWAKVDPGTRTVVYKRKPGSEVDPVALLARLRRERARLATANGEGYTEIAGTIAGLEAMLVRLVKPGA